jgi:nitrate/nitrite-specific signal transduction histidine kinase
MIQAIDEINAEQNATIYNNQTTDRDEIKTSFAKFDENLKLQQNNVTEIGEKELTTKIQQRFSKYRSLLLAGNTSLENKQLATLNEEIKILILSVSTLNMHAILLKNELLTEKINHSYKIISIVLAISFMISFTFMINFPSSISEPLNKLSVGVKEMVNSNFSNKIRITSNDEFRELAESLNSMAEKLEKNNSIVNNSQPIVSEIEPINENMLLHQIAALLAAIHPIINSLEISRNNESLLRQTKALSKIEMEISKFIEE